MSVITGVALAIGGNTLGSVALVTQKHAHNQNQKLASPQNITRNPVWVLGLVLMVAGELGNFAAYGYAPAMVVAPLGAVSVVANAILARVVLKEAFLIRHLIGIIFAIAGSVIIVVSAPNDDGEVSAEEFLRLISETAFIVYIVLLVLTVALLFRLAPKYGKRTVVIYIGLCSLLGSVTVMCSKGVSTALRLSFEGDNQFTSAVPYILVLLLVTMTVSQVHYLNKAMAAFDSTIVVPVYFVMFTMASILGGLMLYQEFNDMSAGGVFSFAVGFTLTSMGVYFISKKSLDGADEAVKGMGDAWDLDPEDKDKDSEETELSQQRRRSESVSSITSDLGDTTTTPILLAGSGYEASERYGRRRGSTLAQAMRRFEKWAEMPLEHQGAGTGPSGSDDDEEGAMYPGVPREGRAERSMRSASVIPNTGLAFFAEHVAKEREQEQRRNSLTIGSVYLGGLEDHHKGVGESKTKN